MKQYLFVVFYLSLILFSASSLSNGQGIGVLAPIQEKKSEMIRSSEILSGGYGYLEFTEKKIFFNFLACMRERFCPRLDLTEYVEKDSVFQDVISKLKNDYNQGFVSYSIVVSTQDRIDKALELDLKQPQKRARIYFSVFQEAYSLDRLYIDYPSKNSLEPDSSLARCSCEGMIRYLVDESSPRNDSVPGFHLVNGFLVKNRNKFYLDFMNKGKQQRVFIKEGARCHPFIPYFAKLKIPIQINSYDSLDLHGKAVEGVSICRVKIRPSASTDNSYGFRNYQRFIDFHEALGVQEKQLKDKSVYSNLKRWDFKTQINASFVIEYGRLYLLIHYSKPVLAQKRYLMVNKKMEDYLKEYSPVTLAQTFLYLSKEIINLSSSFKGELADLPSDGLFLPDYPQSDNEISMYQRIW